MVPAIEVARLTRWQLVFEPFRRDDTSDRPQIWLGRGAPRRWFRSIEGFGATGFPLGSAGGARLSFDVRTGHTAVAPPQPFKATYLVQVFNASGAFVRLSGQFVLRWPGKLEGGNSGMASVNTSGCVFEQAEAENGLVVSCLHSLSGALICHRLE